MGSKLKLAIFAALLSIIGFNGHAEKPSTQNGALRVDTLKVAPTGFPGGVTWRLKGGKRFWTGSMLRNCLNHGTSFSFQNQSWDFLEKNGRTTNRICSYPFKIGPDNFTCVQESSKVKGFPGVLFRFSMKNEVKLAALAPDLQFSIQAKGRLLTSWRGKRVINRSYTGLKKIRNWVFIPSPAGPGLALIANFSESGVGVTTILHNSRKSDKKNSDSMSVVIRKLYQRVPPAGKSELLFVLAPANSAEEVVELCEKLESAMIFPELKLEPSDCSVQKSEQAIAQNKPSINEVNPLLNPRYYSAGDADAKSIEDWVTKEIRPELFDIWAGKKDRIYLNGSWKLLKLSGTRDLPDCEYGVKHGFEKSNFNDSKWFNQPVPFPWNISLKIPNGEDFKRRIIWGGVGWYRRKFQVPTSAKSKRVVLCFPEIDREATVFINGKKAAYHKNISLERTYMKLFRTQHEYFEVDITPYLNFDGENTLAVKVYEDGDPYNVPLNKPNPKQRLKSVGTYLAGIWQEVYLDIRPDIYLKKAMLEFNFQNSTAKIKAYVVNNRKNTVREQLRLEFTPWKSKRYSLADGDTFNVEIGVRELKPGMNQLTFKVKLDKAQLWSPEVPFLYEMKLANAKGDVLGEERVGIRDFKAGADSFYINGKKITLRGQQCLWWHLVRLMMNRRGEIEKWYDMYKDLNHNITRNHSTFFPHAFYDIADEKGVMIYNGQPFGPLMPLFDENGAMTDFYRSKIKETAEEAERHPSIVAFSMGNELYDSKLEGEKIDVYQHYLDQVYDEFKKHNQSTLVCASGRAPNFESMKKTGGRGLAYCKKHAKTDFYAMHNYYMCFNDPGFAEDDEWPNAFKKLLEAYILDDGPKVLWNTESLISSIPIPTRRLALDWDKKFRSHMKDGKLDRKWFAEECSFVPRSNKGYDSFNRRWSVPKFGFLGLLQGSDLLSQADFMKREIELHRRKRQYVAGVVGNCPMIFQRDLMTRETKYQEPVSTAVRKANQPVLACFDGKWNRNVFSGTNPPTPLHVINDHEEIIAKTIVKVSLKALDGNGDLIHLKSVQLEKLAPAEMKTLDYSFEIPESIKSGHYSVILTVTYNCRGQEARSTNDYQTFVLNQKDIKLNAAATSKIAVFRGAGKEAEQTVGILKKLNLQFTMIEKLEELADFKILLLPAYCQSFPEGIGDWIKNGGKLICLEQSNMPAGVPQKTIKNVDYGYRTELIRPSHPVFKGLKQSDFTYWNGERNQIQNKWVSDYSLVPLNEGVLASQMTMGCRVGMNAAEYHLEKGTCFLSQMDVVKRFGTDSVATKYLLNLLNYCLADWADLETPTLKGASLLAGPAYKVDPKKAFPIDLRPVCTMGFKDDMAGDGKGGWTDQGPKNDLRNMPIGKQTFNGVPFEIIDPKSNDGKACVVLRGNPKTGTAFLPEKCHISVNRKAEKLYFLVSAAWMGGCKKTIATINISEEADGTEMASFFQVDLVPNRNILDWWDPTPKPPEAELGWIGFAGGGKHYVGSLIVEWVNPYPGKKIQHIDFESSETAVPALIAITGVE